MKQYITAFTIGNLIMMPIGYVFVLVLKLIFLTSGTAVLEPDESQLVLSTVMSIAVYAIVFPYFFWDVKDNIKDYLDINR